MKSSKVGWVALALWIVTVAAGSWSFLKGWTTKGSDNRTAVQLAPIERDMVLGEMRQLLSGLHGILTGLAESDLKKVEQAARGNGMGMAVDESPALIAKLPMAFKEMGMSLHRSFDEMADGVKKGENQAQILRRLSNVTASCVSCHQQYRFSPNVN